ncbi:MAG TPA: tail fiber domain-containing protein, partial [Chryseolinea sp.]|nr:tail fiber domain-containing protein [Chryseolinea sp.]
MKRIILFVFLVPLSNILFAQQPFPQPFPLYFNTYYGAGAFASNTTGNYNAAFGNYALNKNLTGNYNTAVGAWALYNSNNYNNVGVGRRAGYATTTGGSNTAVGANAMQNNTTGLSNVAVGTEAMNNNVGGYFNTAVGNSSGPAFGSPDLYNATAIGYYAINTGNQQVRIGNEFVTDIGGHVSWSTLSDGRFKTDVKEDIAGLEFINKLRPVSYIVDEKALSNSLRIPDSVSAHLQVGRKPAVRQTGFVAQEVEAIVKKGKYSFNAVNAPQNEQDHYSIRYAEFVVPLVKAVQELSAKLEAQDKEMKALKKQIGAANGAGRDSTVDDRLDRSGAALYQNYLNPFSIETEIA